MHLTGRQKRHLRAIGNRLPAAATIGKASLSAPAVANVSALLAQSELIKVRLPDSLHGSQRRAAAAELAQAADAQCVGVVGRTALLYRANEALPADKRVRLEP